MVCKTKKGFLRKELSGDGRVSQKNWTERELGFKPPTKTEKKELRSMQIKY